MNVLPEVLNPSKFDRIDAGQLFSERVPAQRVGHPEGEIVRRLRRQIVVLLDEAMGMIINGRSRHLH